MRSLHWSDPVVVEKPLWLIFCFVFMNQIVDRSTLMAILSASLTSGGSEKKLDSLDRQEPKLFHMDVKSNITYGCGEDITEEEVEQAAKLAHAHDFILALPDGYRTMVDSNLLSGGQKQRIAIARAIIRKPPILVLDEATSALDSQTEHFVKEITEAFISGEMWKTTIIVITHRLSSVKTADRIIVMDGGRIVEMGGHKELLQENGLYSRLVKLQSSSIT
ncbi:ABC transporter B family member 26, chloroplastic [Linum perenne]